MATLVDDEIAIQVIWKDTNWDALRWFETYPRAFEIRLRTEADRRAAEEVHKRPYQLRGSANPSGRPHCGPEKARFRDGVRYAGTSAADLTHEAH